MTSNDRVVYKWIKSKIIRKKFNIDISLYDEDKLLFVTGIERIHTIMVRTTSDKLISSTFQGFLCSLVKYFSTLEDKFHMSVLPCNILYLFNKSAFFNCPFLNILLAKSRHGVMYNYYFFSHGWLHITPSILLPDTTLMENDWVWLAIASEVQRQPLK